ncbi:MAG: hypothetical protein AAF739_16215 [Pseudomonadota bacterium]
MPIFIEIALGLVFFYLLMSLTCTTFNELLANVLRLRAKVLYEELQRLLDDPSVRTRFWNNGLIRSLCRECDTVTGRQAPSYLSGETFAQALIQASSNGSQAEGGSDRISDTIEEGSLLKEAVTSLENAVVSQAQSLESAIANWFDTVMERTSGIYVRRMQWVSFGVALTIALATNANTFSVAQALWQDDALRAQVSQAAEQYVAAVPPLVEERLEESTLTELAAAVEAELETISEDLRPFPLGWTGIWDEDDGFGTKIGKVIVQVPGIVITALAMTLGAPFWFDLLQRFMHLRSAGRKPQSSATGT